MCADPERPSFIAAVLAGNAEPTEIDDYVEAWHDHGGDVPLAEYLGMTEGEYASWVEHPAMLNRLLQARRHSAAVKR